MKKIAIILNALLLISCNSGSKLVNTPQTTSDRPDNVLDIANGIISINPALNAMLPLVLIQNSPNNFTLCSGTLISATKVLTAAHCVLNMTAKPYSAKYTSKNIASPAKIRIVLPKNLNLAVNLNSPAQNVNNWLIYPVARAYVHRNAFVGAQVSQQGLTIFDPTNLNDLAILTLTTPVAKQYGFAKLANQNPLKNSIVTIAGYGINYGSGVISRPKADSGYAGVLRLANSSVVSVEANGSLIYIGSKTANNLGYTKTCVGDSGGPDLTYANNSYTVIGVHSFGDNTGGGCGSGNISSASISVAYYNSWITSGYLSNYLN